MGGLAGHMSHLYDNPRLTFTQIKNILRDAAAGDLKGTEKTDGQNLYISFSVPNQVLQFTDDEPSGGIARAARNKTNIKSGGMNIKQLAAKFSANKSLKRSFSQALRDFENVIKKFPRAKQEEIFGTDTNIYYNADIVNPETANVINYDSKLVSIHRGGGSEFDKETGSPVEVDIVDPVSGEIVTGPKDVSKYSNILADELDKIQQDLSDNKFKIEVDAFFNLRALDDEKALNKAISEIDSEISSEGISDDKMIIEYIMARILSIIKEYGMDLDEETEGKLLKRVLLSNASYRAAYGYDKMPKELDPRKIVKGASPKDKNNAIYIIKNAAQILKNAIAPIEIFIHDFSVEMLKGLESLFILDNKKEANRLRVEVSKAIKAIKKSGNEDALEILQKQMNKLKSVENISTAAEGFVFDYDGWSYKFTGNFAPINQILGLFKYGRKGIPPLENLNEDKTEQDKRTIVLYPGRFQPMGRHHAAVFQKLQENYGHNNVFIVTSGKVDAPKSPLNFEEKKKIIMKHGILESQILKFSNLYGAEELRKHFNPAGTIVEYAVGQKDMNTNPRFSNLDGVCSDGTPTYFRSLDENRENLKTFDDHGYIMVAPHISISLSSGKEMSGSSLREAMADLTPGGFESAMGWFDKDIYEMLKGKISKSPMSLSESIFSIIEEIYSEGIEKCTSDLEERIHGPDNWPSQDSYSRSHQEVPEKTHKSGIRVVIGKPDTPDTDDDTDDDMPDTDGEEPFDPLEEYSGAGAIAGPSLPLGMKSKYFNDTRPEVKGIKFYNKKKKN